MTTRKKVHRARAFVPPPPPPRVDWDEAVRLHTEQGVNPAEIARALGFSAVTIRQGLMERGVYEPRRLLGAARVQRRQRLYMLWHRMHRRCRDPAFHQYRNFGAKGIDHCEEWEDFENFYEWAERSGYKVEYGLVIDRREKGYTPRNCRWLPSAEAHIIMLRHAGPRPAKRPLTAFGETKAKEAWLRDLRCVVSSGALNKRLDRGIPDEIAISYSPERLARLPKSPDWRPARRATRQRRPEPDWAEAAKLRRAGWTTARLAEKYGVSVGWIGQGLARRGEKAPPPEGRMKRPHWRLVYKKWISLRNRCNNPSFVGYQFYGAKGVRVCRAWDTFEPFYEWAMATGFEPQRCLTRVHKGRPYSPDNCVWESKSHTSLHADHPVKSKRKPRWTLTAFGETKGITEWSRDPRCTVSLTNLLARLHKGMTPEEALATPPALPGRGGELFIDAFGERQSLSEWARDRRCKVTQTTLRQRLLRGVAPEEAITSPAYRSPSLLAGLPRKIRRRPMVRRRRESAG